MHMNTVTAYDMFLNVSQKNSETIIANINMPISGSITAVYSFAKDEV